MAKYESGRGGGNPDASKWDGLKTRAELGYSGEKKEVQDAVSYLMKIGFLKKVSDTKLYHGRVKPTNETTDWHVDASLDNAGNNTGNRNINKYPALSTGSREVGIAFAKARTRKVAGTPEVHEIVAKNPNARYVDAEKFTYPTDAASKAKFRDAIRATLPPLSESIALDWEDRKVGTDKITAILAEKGQDGNGYLRADDYAAIAKKYGVRQELVAKLATASNTYRLLASGPDKMTLSKVMRDKTSFVIGQHGYPISPAYTRAWMRKMGAIGTKTVVDSATLGKTIDNILIYELDDVDDSKEIARERTERSQQFGKTAIRMAEILGTPKRRGNVAETIAKKAYATPREILDEAKKTPGFEKIFDLDAGNWEGYTVREHTETTLRIFEENFADKIPVTLLPLMRTTLLVHDIGKGVAARDGRKSEQKKYNVAYAEEFMTRNNYDSKTIGLVTGMIGEGADLSTKLFVKNEPGARRKLGAYCDQLLEKFYEGSGRPVTFEDRQGLMVLMQILQTCDSGAYTSYAKTERKDKIKYSNYGSFNKSFKQKYGLTDQRFRLKTPDEKKGA